MSMIGDAAVVAELKELLQYLEYLKESEDDIFNALDKLENRMEEDLEASRGGWI